MSKMYSTCIILECFLELLFIVSCFSVESDLSDQNTKVSVQFIFRKKIGALVKKKSMT